MHKQLNAKINQIYSCNNYYIWKDNTTLGAYREVIYANSKSLISLSSFVANKTLDILYYNFFIKIVSSIYSRSGKTQNILCFLFTKRTHYYNLLCLALAISPFSICNQIFVSIPLLSSLQVKPCASNLSSIYHNFPLLLFILFAIFFLLIYCK